VSSQNTKGVPANKKKKAQQLGSYDDPNQWGVGDRTSSWEKQSGRVDPLTRKIFPIKLRKFGPKKAMLHVSWGEKGGTYI